MDWFHEIFFKILLFAFIFVIYHIFFKYESQALYIVPLRFRDSERENCDLHLIFGMGRVGSTQFPPSLGGERPNCVEQGGRRRVYAVWIVILRSSDCASTRKIRYRDRVELKITGHLNREAVTTAWLNDACLYLF